MFKSLQEIWTGSSPRKSMTISKQMTKRRFFCIFSHFLRKKTGEDLGLWILIREGHIPSASHTNRGKRSVIAVLYFCYWTTMITHHLFCCLLHVTLRQWCPSSCWRGNPRAHWILWELVGCRCYGWSRGDAIVSQGTSMICCSFLQLRWGSLYSEKKSHCCVRTPSFCLVPNNIFLCNMPFLSSQISYTPEAFW